MRMRTIEQAAGYIKSIDPETAFTKTALRRAVISGELPSIRVGLKYLVALENIDAYLLGHPERMEDPAAGKIRQVTP